MPVIQIYTPSASPPAGFLSRLCGAVAKILEIEETSVWALWHTVPLESARVPSWDGAGRPAPVCFVYCRRVYSRRQVIEVMTNIRDLAARECDCAAESVFIAVQRVEPFELLARGQVWTGAPAIIPNVPIPVGPVGIVRSPVAQPRDDIWGGVVSEIELDASQFTESAVAALGSFSHIQVVFFMHLVPESKIERGARHPRNRADWPEVGIFAQRAKARPNRLGVSTCRLLRITGLILTVLELDAIDGTPVLDIKPYMEEFGPRGVTEQPPWSKELMAGYFQPNRDVSG